MLASERFEQKRLQGVVLAQSEQIRAAGRLSGFQKLTRPLVALTAIVAFAAIFVGIKDYVGEQKQASPADRTGVASSAITRPQKSTSKKTRRTGMSASRANASALPHAGADPIEKAP